MRCKSWSNVKSEDENPNGKARTSISFFSRCILELRPTCIVVYVSEMLNKSIVLQSVFHFASSLPTSVLALDIGHIGAVVMWNDAFKTWNDAFKTKGENTNFRYGIHLPYIDF